MDAAVETVKHGHTVRERLEKPLGFATPPTASLIISLIIGGHIYSVLRQGPLLSRDIDGRFQGYTVWQLVPKAHLQLRTCILCLCALHLGSTGTGLVCFQVRLLRCSHYKFVCCK